MNNIINPDDRDYYDGKLYEVGIWPGAGYQLTTFKVYAANEQEALELVVADAELHNENLLMSIPEMENYIAEDWSEECNKFMQENEDRDADEYTFAEEYLNYIYVDATMQGASQPYFINGENLSIKEISENDKVEESKDTQKVFNIKWDTESDGEVVDQKELNLPSETTVPANLSDDEIADYLSDEYGYCVFSYNTENDLKESKEIKEEARLTDYLGILQIRDILQKNPETADKEFAILDNMKVEVGTGNNVKIYKATKNADDEWELTATSKKEEKECQNKLVEDTDNEEHIIWDSEIGYYDEDYKNEIRDNQYQDYLDNFEPTIPEPTEPLEFEKWYENYIEDISYEDMDVLKDDLENNILPTIDSQMNYNCLILSGYYGSNYPDFKSSGNGGKMFDGIDDFENYMSRFDRTTITTQNGILGATLYDHDGTVSGEFYTLPENLTELVKAMNYETYVDIPEEITDEKEIFETVMDQFEEDLVYGNVDVRDLTEHIDLLKPIKDTISGYAPDPEPKKENKEITLDNAPLKSVTETVEYISRKEYDEMPEDYKTTISKTLQARQAVGDNIEELKNLYKNLGYEETDPMIMVNDNGGTVLKPVKIQEEKEITEETLEEAINRAHQEEISAIDTYDTVLSKTDDTTDIKLIDMINEIKADEEDHKLLLQHYIETGEALTDDELEELKNKSSEETDIVEEKLLGPSNEVIEDSKEKGLYTENNKSNIETAYAQDRDLTFILETITDDNGNIVSTEVKGFYFGRPDEETTKQFINKGLKATFDTSIKESKQLNEELKHPELNNSIKEYYLNNSTDELGKELNDVTFLDLYRSIKDNYDIYELIGIKDSVVRETLFKELARILNTNYNYVYNMWTYGGVVDGQPNVIKESKQLKENSKDKKAKGISITRAQARDLYDWFLAGDENVGVFKFNNKIDTYRVNSSTGTPEPIYNGTAEYVIDIVDYMKEMTPYYIKNKRDGIDTVYRYVNDEIQSNEAKPQEETLEEAKINNFVDKWKDHNDFKCGWCGTVFKGKIDDNGRMPNCPHCLEDRFADDKEKLDDGYANKDVHFYDTEKKDEIYTDFECNIVESKCITEALDNSTITEELNTGVLPIVAIDMYSLSDNLNEYDITQEDLDEIAQELAPKYIEDTLREILPNVSVVTKSVYHPKQYNFEGDELEFDLTVDRQAYETLKENALNNPEFETFLKDNYSTRDGFISAMAYNVDKFKQQPEWKQMVQVIMFNVSDDKIQENNEHYVDEFLERVSMTAGPAIDESKSLTEDNNEEPEFDPSNEVDDEAMNTEFKVGDVVADIVDGDIAIVEALPDKDDGTYTLRFVTGVCSGDAYQYKKGRFKMVKYEDIRKEALEIYNDNMKPEDNPLKKA